MRTSEQLVHSRARLRPRFALFPLEGFPPSRLPGFEGCEARILASPALGAQFLQYLIDLPAARDGALRPDARVETFYYLMSGAAMLSSRTELRAGSFGLL